MALGGSVLMCVAGLYKYIASTRDNAKVLSIHGKVGPAVWVCGHICICLAAWFEYLEGAGHWTIGQAAAIWIGVGALFLALVAHSHMGSRDHLAGELKDNDGSGEYFIKRTALLVQ